MKKMTLLAVAAGIAALAACNKSPQDQAADNIQANADAVADNLDAAADNATSDAAKDNLQNQADATRAVGENQAKDLKTHDADTNLANGL